MAVTVAGCYVGDSLLAGGWANNPNPERRDLDIAVLSGAALRRTHAGHGWM